MISDDIGDYRQTRALLFQNILTVSCSNYTCQSKLSYHDMGGESKPVSHKTMQRSTKKTKYIASKVKMANEAARQRTVPVKESNSYNGSAFNNANGEQFHNLHESRRKCVDEKRERTLNNQEVVVNGNDHLIETNGNDSSDDQKSNGHRNSRNGMDEKTTVRKTSFGEYIEKKAGWLFEPEYFVPEKQSIGVSAVVKDEYGR